jgi:TrwC relaxase
MRLDVTPLGGAGRTVAQVAGAIVEYLEGGVGDPGSGLLAATVGGSAGDELVSYYGDSPEGPGRWIGQGAAAHGLGGTVEGAALARVLEGRHPHTGARLLTAQGSSQRMHLATGTAARFDELGWPLYTAADTARLLGVSRGEIDTMIDDGELETVSIEGERYVPDREVTRLLEEPARPAVERIRAGGDADDWLSGPQAARLLGVSGRYVRRLCGRGEDGIELGTVAQLASERAEHNGAFRIRRGDLAEFAATRKPPIARVGYDLTLTTEKSFAVVMMFADSERQRRFVNALRTANDTAIDHLDRNAAVARRCGEIVSTHGLVGATYFHGTSRALDPHPHHHNVIANAVVDDLGGIRALDARAATIAVVVAARSPASSSRPSLPGAPPPRQVGEAAEVRWFRRVFEWQAAHEPNDA